MAICTAETPTLLSDQFGVAPQLARQINNQGRDDHAHVDPAESYLNAIAEIIKRFRFRQFFPLRVCSVSQRPPFLQSP